MQALRNYQGAESSCTRVRQKLRVSRRRSEPLNNEPQLGDWGWRQPAVDTTGLWLRDHKSLDRTKDVPKDFYSTKTYVDELLQYFQSGSNTDADRPFFAHLPFTAPHWPLKAPQDRIARYKGLYDGGPDVLRERRLEALIQRGLIPSDIEPAPMVGEVANEWADLDGDEKAYSARRMETYAAMVDLFDQHLTRVICYLEETGKLDNTFVLFMSENGAEGMLLEAFPTMAGVPLVKVVKKFYNNAIESVGNADSFV